MYKYLVFGIFLSIFFFLIKRDRVYIIPFILIIYSNINGLLDWEDFALHGVIKFPDYGLVITLLLLCKNQLTRTKKLKWEIIAENSLLYRVICFFWIYYLFLFIYSIMLSGDIEWPIKVGRYFFFGLVTFVIYSQLKRNPIILFDKVIKTLMISTLVFGLMYIGYNLLGIEFYPKEEHEIFLIDGMEVKRNFSGVPTYSFYFLIFFVHRLVSENKFRLLNFFGMLIIATCVALTLTRGAVLTMGVVVIFTIAYRYPSLAIIRKIFIGIIATTLTIPFLLQSGKNQLEVLMLRFSEFSDAGGATESANFSARTSEFYNIVENVINFNPLFGFGFINIDELNLGYRFNSFVAGSPDNGFSNLIGMTGFLGLGIFLLIILLWLIINIKLQLLNKENFSKVNFIFIVYMIMSMFNGSSMSYTHSYAIFLVYDLLAYSYLTKIMKVNSMTTREPALILNNL